MSQRSRDSEPSSRFLLSIEALDLGPDEVLGAAYSPGFQSDLSCWHLWLDRHGVVRQVVRVSTPENGYSEEMREGSVAVGAKVVADLLALAREMLGEGVPEQFEHAATDLESISLAVRFGDVIRTFQAYGAFEAAWDGNENMALLWSVWCQLHRHAPVRDRR
jgi:hypothetical protein